MVGIYIHRISTAFFALAAVIAIVIAVISQERYKAQQRTINHQAGMINALIDTADAQSGVNNAVLKALQALDSRQHRTEGRQLAALRR